MKVFCAAFICLQFGFVIFWQKGFGTKAAHKILVKLTPYNYRREYLYLLKLLIILELSYVSLRCNKRQIFHHLFIVEKNI